MVQVWVARLRLQGLSWSGLLLHGRLVLLLLLLLLLGLVLLLLLILFGLHERLVLDPGGEHGIRLAFEPRLAGLSVGPCWRHAPVVLLLLRSLQGRLLLCRGLRLGSILEVSQVLAEHDVLGAVHDMDGLLLHLQAPLVILLLFLLLSLLVRALLLGLVFRDLLHLGVNLGARPGQDGELLSGLLCDVLTVLLVQAHSLHLLEEVCRGTAGHREPLPLRLGDLAPARMHVGVEPRGRIQQLHGPSHLVHSAVNANHALGLLLQRHEMDAGALERDGQVVSQEQVVRPYLCGVAKDAGAALVILEPEEGLGKVEADGQVVGFQLQRPLVECDCLPRVFAPGAQVGVAEVDVDGGVACHSVVLHDGLERPLGKVKLAPLREYHADPVGGVVRVLLVLQRSREVPQGLLHVDVPVCHLRRFRACHFVVQVPQEYVSVVELLLTCATDRCLGALQCLRVVGLVPMRLRLHERCKHRVRLHRVLIPLHCHVDLAHALPLRAESQERVGVSVVLLVDRHVLLRGLHKVGPVTQALGQPGAVKAHGEVSHPQVLCLLRASLVAFQPPLRQLDASAVGLPRAVGVALEAPQRPEVVPHLRGGHPLGAIALQQLCHLLVRLDACLLSDEVGLLRLQLIVRLRTHGPSLHVLLILGHQGVRTLHSLFGLVPNHHICKT
mmetsp:Transcript_53565/g.143520  ORF Transcript_53565/g.143520 Transcript_53565/m.143520 type:complete len:668 (+) Transcript_53565:271-2274(+)